jgi:Peptidase family M49
MKRIVAALACALVIPTTAGADTSPDLAALQAMAARFAPVDFRVDVSGLPPSERAALVKMIEAAKLFDALFLRQVSAQNEERLLDLVRDTSPLGRARLHYFLLNKGPWSRIDGQTPFLPGVGEKPGQANFYPTGATRSEVEAWMNGLPGDQKEAASGFFTTIRRTPTGNLVVVPYSLEYQGELAQAAALLDEAAALTTQPTLKDFLARRAKAFVSNDYRDSDVAWMDLDASLEPTIGPYEVYEDDWFNFKAGFEAFITVRDDAESSKLGRFSAHLQELEDHLPIDPKFRRAKLGGASPIRVVNVVFSSGDGNRGVQTIAYNLPNDERVVAEKGSKRILLKNSNEAKFKTILAPMARIALSAQDADSVSFEAFFTHTLMHELMHGLGPQTITVGGRDTTVRQELKELNGPLEEAKADVSGLWAIQYLIDHAIVDKALERPMQQTFLASCFRSIRFGIQEAHGRGIAMILNHILDQGGYRANADGTFAVDWAKIKPAVESLTREIMTIQATGDYGRAKALLERMSVIRPQTQLVLDRLKNIPVDIEPRFVTAEELTAR